WYGNMYAGPTNGGVMPLDNSSWSDWWDGFAWRHQCPLSATRDTVDGRSIKGHVDDYWVQYGSSAADPFDGNWTEHTYGECTGDYMKTNQDAYGNTDGSTTFWYYGSGAPTPCSDLEAAGPPYSWDGGCGLQYFYESRGYTVSDAYNQYIYGYDGNTQGFTFAQFQSEINAGRPALSPC
ncbi:unnamed protein product, partial [marine sediment metagenome]